MANLFRKYNQNRKTIWTVMLFVAFFVILLQVIFAIIRSNKNRERQQILEQANKMQNTVQANQIQNETNTNTATSSSNNRENYRKTAEKQINQFAQYCNERTSKTSI